MRTNQSGEGKRRDQPTLHSNGGGGRHTTTSGESSKGTTHPIPLSIASLVSSSAHLLRRLVYALRKERGETNTNLLKRAPERFIRRQTVQKKIGTATTFSRIL